jgi:DNA repair protein RadC
MKKYPEKLSIKAWAEDDRPREKMASKGRSALSDAELVAILIGSGNWNESAVELSKRILKEVNNNLSDLAKLSIEDLKKFKGIGEAKAISIVAALELGRRRKGESTEKKEKITTSKQVHRLFRSQFLDLPHEEFWILLMNRANMPIDKVMISKGGVSGTVADTRNIFKPAIERLASSIILCHNHPSGNLKPSAADIKLTNKLKEVGNIMDIPVLDHLIVSDDGYYSFADEGRM